MAMMKLTSAPSSTGSYSASSTAGANLDKTYSLGEQILTEADTAYAALMEGNQINDALALKDTAEKFARIGSAQGVNSFARTQMFNQFQTQLNAAARKTQGEYAAQKIAQQNSIISTLAGLSASQWQAEAQSMQLAQQAASDAARLAESGRQFDIGTAAQARESEANRTTQAGMVQAQAAAQPSALSQMTREYARRPAFTDYGSSSGGGGSASPSAGGFAPDFSQDRLADSVWNKNSGRWERPSSNTFDEKRRANLPQAWWTGGGSSPSAGWSGSTYKV